MERFFGAIVAVVAFLVLPIFTTISAIISGLRIVPLVTISGWKSIITYLKTGDCDLMWECFDKETEDL